MGGPLVLLQLIAWAGMLVSYTAEDGLVRGMKDTFSGERPCALCKHIEAAESEESAPALPSRDDQRRLAESLGQCFRDPEPVQVPAAFRGEGRPGLSRRAESRMPGRGRPSPETPPPRHVG